MSDFFTSNNTPSLLTMCALLTEDASVPAPRPLGLFDDGGECVHEVGEELVLKVHRDAQYPVQEPRHRGGFLLQHIYTSIIFSQ